MPLSQLNHLKQFNCVLCRCIHYRCHIIASLLALQILSFKTTVDDINVQWCLVIVFYLLMSIKHCVLNTFPCPVNKNLQAYHLGGVRADNLCHSRVDVLQDQYLDIIIINSLPIFFQTIPQTPQTATRKRVKRQNVVNVQTNIPQTNQQLSRRQKQKMKR